ncbi:MAG: lysine 2,3-aminomutase, partial [Actinobacteria bacterium]|nr:lysine 2,3-aminomutase [Actinomycetota bacterium]
MTRSFKDIPLFKDVTEEEWNDYRWQLRNRLTTTADFDRVLNFTDQQRADLDACMGKFRVSVT